MQRLCSWGHHWHYNITTNVYHMVINHDITNTKQHYGVCIYHINQHTTVTLLPIPALLTTYIYMYLPQLAKLIGEATFVYYGNHLALIGD